MGKKQKLSFHKVEKNNNDPNKLIGESDFSKNIQKLRSRVHKILDEQFNWIFLKLQKESRIKNLINDSSLISSVILNEPKLEEWVEMFKHEILQVKVSNILEKDKVKYENSQVQIPFLKFPRPLCPSQNKKTLWHIQNNKLIFFQQNQNPKWEETSYEFDEGVLKKFSSATYISQTNQLIMIGGCKQTNPNIKSSKIICLDLKTSQLKTLMNLSYGISSHSAVLHNQQGHIYIIGGNKNYSIVTRGCFRFDFKKMILEQISCLNYPVSSATCILWKKNSIYKFGGIGDAFGEWNTSPYIERYSISLNEWEVINPSIGQGISSYGIFQNMFLANSAAYMCENQDQIFIFGGYSIEGEFKNYGFVLKIEQGEENIEEDQEKHVIECNFFIYEEYGRIDGENLKNSLNNIFFTRNEFKKILMFSLADYIDTKSVKPCLVCEFDENQAKV